MKDISVLIVLLTNNFLSNTTCKRLFLYSKKKLNKPTQLISFGKHIDWKNDSDIGILCSDDVYINMSSPENFNTKISELIVSLKSERDQQSNKKTSHFFMSYCWSNSKEAIKRGSKFKKGAIGETDPRILKEKLEKSGVDCWMDIEQVGQAGLFQDIAEGLKNAKVVIACVSSEYVNSKNCQMEFRFAASVLRLPIILAIVGTGNTWIKSEIGMLSLDFPRVDLQRNNNGFNEILEFVKDYISLKADKKKHRKV